MLRRGAAEQLVAEVAEGEPVDVGVALERLDEGAAEGPAADQTETDAHGTLRRPERTPSARTRQPARPNPAIPDLAAAGRRRVEWRRGVGPPCHPKSVPPRSA